MVSIAHVCVADMIDPPASKELVKLFFGNDALGCCEEKIAQPGQTVHVLGHVGMQIRVVAIQEQTFLCSEVDSCVFREVVQGIVETLGDCGTVIGHQRRDLRANSQQSLMLAVQKLVSDTEAGIPGRKRLHSRSDLAHLARSETYQPIYCWRISFVALYA